MLRQTIIAISAFLLAVLVTGCGPEEAEFEEREPEEHIVHVTDRHVSHHEHAPTPASRGLLSRYLATLSAEYDAMVREEEAEAVDAIAVPESKSGERIRAVARPTPPRRRCVRGGRCGGGCGGLPAANMGRATKTPRSLPGGYAAEGAMDDESVAQIVRQNRRQLHHCYEQALVNRQELAGHVEVQAVIAPTGNVVLAKIQESTINHPGLELCLLARTKHWGFPPPTDGKFVNITYNMHFNPDIYSGDRPDRRIVAEPSASSGPRRRACRPSPREQKM